MLLNESEMKNLIMLTMALLTIPATAQMVIGGKVGSAGTNTQNVLLDFATGQNKGIILPYVRTLPTSPTPGTILLDATASGNNGKSSRISYWNSFRWVNLSNGYTGDLTAVPTKGGGTIDVIDTQPPTSVNEDPGQKVIIGAPTSSADGVLVLESPNKAMVLPQVTSTNEVTDPAPGMMVYITSPNSNGNKLLAVFNGLGWTYWEPSK